jgi:small subunit ribosomal protein S16
VAVRIRMKRLGRKHRPFFRICVMDSRSPRDGKAIEELGFYDPMVRVKKDRVKIDMERIDYWLGVGAQPSVNVKALIKKVRTNRFGEAAAPPPMAAPKPRPAKQAEPAAEAPAETAAE